jgi:hypothetical protein
MIYGSWRCARIFLFALVLLGSFSALRSEAGDHHRRQRAGQAVYVTRARPDYAPTVTRVPTGTLGTFEPTPYIMLRGNQPLGGGYSPLGISGDQTMSLYGPFSPLRARTAPVFTYVRGYDGQLRVLQGDSSSYPNRPELSPVIYPNEFSNYYGPRMSRTPPWWSSAFNWLDQN